MSVSAEYLTKIRRSIRRSDSEEINAELTDLIEECRLDLQQVGVLQIKADDEADPVILGAVRCFVRWKFGVNNAESELNKNDYMELRDEIRKRRGYCISATQ